VTLLADPLAPPVPWWRRVWGLPVWAHLLALAASLLLLVPVVGTSNSFVADEGAAVIQAKSLQAGEGWIVEHPLPEVDPEGRWYPVVNAERGTKGFAPLGKHPLYPTLAAAAARVGGVAGMVVLSLLGTVAAAGLAAALAGRIDKALVRPTLWVVGLASPLLFDGFLVMGHTLGAALATGAVLVAVVAVQERRPAVALLVAPAVGGAVLLRNEALLFVVALVVVSGFLAVRRAYRVPAGVVAAAAVVGAGGARLLERVWLARITGRAVSATAVANPAAEGSSFVQGRVDGFVTTWLTPGYGGLDLGTLALLVMLAAIGWCALRVRLQPEGRTPILAAAGVAAGAAVVALAVDPSNVVPGLLLAFPVATAGLLAVRRNLFGDVGAQAIGAIALLFALAVIATQYAVGGSGEWGGRYFALLVPAAVPLLLAALRAEGRSLAADVRRAVAVALVVCSAALAIMAVASLRAQHRAGAQVVARIEAAGRLTGDTRPVVVTDWIAGSRLAWPTFDDHRWLYVTKSRIAEAVDRLGAAGVDRFVLVSNDVAVLQERLGGVTVVASDVPASGRQIVVLDR
jgi:hypothetical protein